jgi:hypothetical protein
VQSRKVLGQQFSKAAGNIHGGANKAKAQRWNQCLWSGHSDLHSSKNSELKKSTLCC